MRKEKRWRKQRMLTDSRRWKKAALMAAAIAVVVATVWNGRGVDAKGLRGELKYVNFHSV
jgi:hypothetical protein